MQDARQAKHYAQCLCEYICMQETMQMCAYRYDSVDHVHQFNIDPPYWINHAKKMPPAWCMYSWSHIRNRKLNCYGFMHVLI